MSRGLPPRLTPTRLALPCLVALAVAGPGLADDLDPAEAQALVICTQPGLTHDERASALGQAGWAVLGIGSRDPAVAALSAAEAPITQIATPDMPLAQSRATISDMLAAEAATEDLGGIRTTWLAGGLATGQSFVHMQTNAQGASCAIVLGRPFTAEEVTAMTGIDSQSRMVAGGRISQFFGADGALVLSAVFPDAQTYADAGVSPAPALILTPPAQTP